MKTKNILLYLLAGTIFLCGCGDDGEDVDSDNADLITDIIISSDKTTIKPTGEDKITLTAVDQDGNDISDNEKVFYFANGTRIPRKFGLRSAGTFTIQAKKDDIKSNELSVKTGLVVKSITISTDMNSITGNGFSAAILSARDQDDDVITNFVDFYANDQKLKTHYFSSLKEGSFELKAKYREIVSDNTVSVEVQANSSRGKKVLIEEFTGEWCGWCPQAGYNLDLLLKRGSAVIVSAIHGGRRDQRYKYDHESTLMTPLGLNGFPAGVVDRKKVEGAIFNAVSINDAGFKRITDRIEEILETPAQLGIAIETELDGSTVIIRPRIKLYEEMASDIYYTIYINENKLDGAGQANYFSNNANFIDSKFYTQPNPLTDYEHNHVLRKNVTDASGELISFSYIDLEKDYEPDPVDVDLSEYVVENCEIVVFVHQSLSGGKSVLNAQMVAPGESIDYLGTLSK